MLISLYKKNRKLLRSFINEMFMTPVLGVRRPRLAKPLGFSFLRRYIEKLELSFHYLSNKKLLWSFINVIFMTSNGVRCPHLAKPV